MASRNSSLASVENAIAIVELATSNNLSLSEASRQSDFGRNYVSDVKSRLDANKEAKNIDTKTYRKFKAALKTYKKVFN